MRTILEILQDLFVILAIMFAAWVVYDTGAAEMRASYERVIAGQ